MKQLLITITLIAAMVFAAKKVKDKSNTVELEFVNKSELDQLLNNVSFHANELNENLEQLKSFDPILR